MKYNFIIIIWLFSFNVKAQQVYFNNIYPLNYAVTNATGIVQNGDSYYAAGVGFVHYETNQKAIIYKLNSSGQLIDSLSFKLDSTYLVSFPRNIEVTKNGFFLNYNIVLNHVGPPQTDTMEGVILKIDTNLNLQWIKYYIDTLYVSPNDTVSSFSINNISSTFDGGLISVVAMNSIGPMFKLAIMKTDSLGNTKWIKYIVHFEQSYCIKQSEYDSCFYYVSQNALGTLLHKLNTQGNEIWNTTLLQPTPMGQFSAHDVSITPEGDIVAGLNEMYDNDLYKKKIHIWKVSGTSGQIIWDKEYFFRYTVDNIYIALHQAMGLDVLHDGSIIWSGHTLDFGGYGGIMKFNSNGDSLWSRMLQHGGLDSNTFFWGIWDLEPTSDNGFIVCGSQKDFATGTGVTAWVVKLDSMGCDTPGCESVSINRAVSQFSSLAVYPNPATDFINIKIPKQYRHQNNKIIVYDLRAIKISEIIIPKNKEFIKLNINHFPTGSYYLQFLSNAKFVANGNFIKQ